MKQNQGGSRMIVTAQVNSKDSGNCNWMRGTWCFDILFFVFDVCGAVCVRLYCAS